MTDERAEMLEYYIVPPDQQLILDRLTAELYGLPYVPPTPSKQNSADSATMIEDNRNESEVGDVTSHSLTKSRNKKNLLHIHQKEHEGARK